MMGEDPDPLKRRVNADPTILVPPVANQLDSNPNFHLPTLPPTTLLFSSFPFETHPELRETAQPASDPKHPPSLSLSPNLPLSLLLFVENFHSFLSVRTTTKRTVARTPAPLPLLPCCCCCWKVQTLNARVWRISFALQWSLLNVTVSSRTLSFYLYKP